MKELHLYQAVMGNQKTLSNKDDRSDKIKYECYQKLLFDEKEGKLSHDRTKLLDIYKAYYSKMVIKVEILRFTKGGFIVDASGVVAFLPFSASYINRSFQIIVGAFLDANVIRVTCDPQKVIVGRHLIVGEEYKGKELLLSYDLDDVPEGHFEEYLRQSKVYYTDDELLSKAEEYFDEIRLKQQQYRGDLPSDSDIIYALDRGLGDFMGF